MELHFNQAHLPELSWLLAGSSLERTALFAATLQDGRLETVEAIVPDQHCRGAHVECTDEGDEQLLAFVARQREAFGQGWVLVWAHTHPRMGTSPSGTDAGMVRKWADCGETVACLIFNPDGGLVPAFNGAHAMLHEWVQGQLSGHALAAAPLKLRLPCVSAFDDRVKQKPLLGAQPPFTLRPPVPGATLIQSVRGGALTPVEEDAVDDDDDALAPGEAECVWCGAIEKREAMLRDGADWLCDGCNKWLAAVNDPDGGTVVPGSVS